MMTLFDHEEALNAYLYEERKEAYDKGYSEGFKEGFKEGLRESFEEGQNQMFILAAKLLHSGRLDDL